MSEVVCPMDYPNHDCNQCPGQFSKDGLCDWPYIMGICPQINECGKLKMVLDKDFPFDEMYADAMRDVCRKCTEKRKLYPLVV